MVSPAGRGISGLPANACRANPRIHRPTGESPRSDTGFSFALAGVDRTNNATWYASKGGGAEHAMKTALKTGGDNTLNVYTTSGGSYLGYAYLPEITNTTQAYLDGVVIDWRTVPDASSAYAGIYDQGDTLVH